MHGNLQDRVDLKRVLKEHDQSFQYMAREMICRSRSSSESLSSNPQADAWPLIFFISHFGIPLLFSLLTTAFQAVWFVKFFSGHKSFSSEYSFMFFMINCVFLIPCGKNFGGDQSYFLAKSSRLVLVRISEKFLFVVVAL